MNVWMAPGGLHITLGRVEDAPDLARLHAAGFHRGWPRADFEAYLTEPRVTPAYVVRAARGKIFGFAMLRLSGDESELLTIAVDPARRGKGLGAALLKASFEDLRMSPVRTMFLEVDETNAPALALYKRFGFAPIGTRKAYYPKPDGSAATALVMRADLG